ncbi:MAG: formylglycine-generating enzyme family protein [Bacteroidota bacterium]|nr:formylglycine-generating enzyme family protein [Bacteroidota bacterium]
MKDFTEQFDFSDQHFDVLLNHALLATEKKFIASEKMMETIAQHIFNSENAATLSESKSNLVIEKLAYNFGKRNKFRLNIFLIALLFVGTILAALYFNSTTKENAVSSNTSIQGKKQNSIYTPLPVAKQQEIETDPVPVANPLVFVLNDSTEETTISQISNGADRNYIPTTFHIPEDAGYAYEDIPALSEAEIKQTAKDKLKMLKDIANPKKKIYAFVPMSTTKVNGAIVSVQAFNIKNTEVSNLEYRTFLNDLLVQGKFEDYLTAVPIKDGWKTAGAPEFENVYFSSFKYNDFPAVNMSRAGAELYCYWLTKSMQDAIKSKEIKLTKEFKGINDVRLPYNVEWICAARAGKDSLNIKYPWQFVSKEVYNARGCYLCNFNFEVSKDHLKPAGECPYQWNGKPKQGGFHRSIITTAGLAIDTLLTAPVTSYNPSDYGQYCMMGNVSEMVWEWKADGQAKKGAALALGGNWNSDVNNILIEAPEQYAGITNASAMIGFRPVWTVTK